MKKLLLFPFYLLVLTSFAQNTLSYTDSEVHFRNGIELYEKKVYPAAHEEFKHYIEANEKALNPNDFNLTIAAYYSALASLYAQSPDADIEIERFVINHADHPKAKVIYVDLGKYFYDQGDYAKAITYFEKAINNLGNNHNSAEIAYKLGMSYYQTQDLPKALTYFDQVKIGTNEYANDASYYAATINFKKEYYDEALADFKRIENANKYKADVPNWIADILFRQKKFDEMLAYTEAIINNPQGRKIDNLALLTAEVYFFEPNYEKAAKYYEMFRSIKKGAVLDEQISFRHAYALFKTNDFRKASEYFKKIATKNNLLGQQAAYYLGISSLKNSDYQAAAAAFQQAKNLDFDKVIKEEAHFNLAKVQLESNSNQGVVELQNYIKTYPDGRFEDEANEILSNVMFQSNNYASAIAYIEGLKRRTPKINTAYQKLCYNQGVLDFNGERFEKALLFFDKAATNGNDAEIKKNSLFWKAEAAYALKRDDAAALYQNVLAQNDEVLKQKSLYSLGYLYYNNKDYKQAIIYFKDFTAKAKNDADSKQNYDDAVLRMADCFLVSKNYEEALKLYDQAITNNKVDKDYALYQKALTLTFMGKPNDAKVLYDKLSQQYPNSRLLDNAYYQNGVIALENINYQEAINHFSKLLKDRPKSNLIPATLLKRALAYSNLKNYEAALSDYRVIVTKFCSSPEAQEALTGLQDVLTNVGRPEEFSDALAAYKRGCPESGSVDNLEYDNAKNLYMTEKYDKAILALQRYINNNSVSNNAFEAKYYLADSYFMQNDKTNALKYYNQVIADNRTNFVSKAAIRAAPIEFGLKNFKNAIAYYKVVTTSSTNKRDIVSAWQGLLESYYNNGGYDSTMFYCKEIINNGGDIVIGASNKAQLYIGKAYMQKGDSQKAEEEFKKTIAMAKDANGAEAKYFIGFMQYQAKKHKESIKTMQELAQSFSDYLYWYEKGFILIADNYIALDDMFMAKATLKSIIDNSETPETQNIAKAKLKTIENK